MCRHEFQAKIHDLSDARVTMAWLCKRSDLSSSVCFSVASSPSSTENGYFNGIMLDYRNDVRLERWDTVKSRGIQQILRGTMQPNFKSGVVGSRYELFEESLPANPLALPIWLLADGMLVCTLLISTFNEDPRSCVRFFFWSSPGVSHCQTCCRCRMSPTRYRLLCLRAGW